MNMWLDQPHFANVNPPTKSQNPPLVGFAIVSAPRAAGVIPLLATVAHHVQTGATIVEIVLSMVVGALNLTTSASPSKITKSDDPKHTRDTPPGAGRVHRVRGEECAELCTGPP